MQRWVVHALVPASEPGEIPVGRSRRLLRRGGNGDNGTDCRLVPRPLGILTERHVVGLAVPAIDQEVAPITHLVGHAPIHHAAGDRFNRRGVLAEDDGRERAVLAAHPLVHPLHDVVPTPQCPQSRHELRIYLPHPRSPLLREP